MIALVVCVVCLIPNHHASAQTSIREISSSTVTPFSSATSVAVNPNGALVPQFRSAVSVTSAAAVRPNGTAPFGQASLVKRSQTRAQNTLGVGPLRSLASPRVDSSAVVGLNPQLRLSFDGINGVSQRLANSGNQYDYEPPDQGLCAGNGYVVESINIATRVYDTSGNPLTGVTDLNTFFGYPAAINRTTGVGGPYLTDPACYYDSDTRRWFQSILVADVDPITGAFLGPNRIDLAVSATPDPTGSWVVYHLPTQDDGTEGTPNHGCSYGPCFGDFPHIGADRFGFYVTTNEYSFFGPEFKSAQIYAFSKGALAANAPTVTVVQFDTTTAVQSSKGVQPGFTVWPAIAPASQHQTGAHGTEFFLSSNAAQEATNVAGGTFSNELIVWALSNTASLNTGNPAPVLRNKVVRSEVYGIPPPANQKAGNVPQADCLNIDCLGIYGLPPTTQAEGTLDSSDSRVLQAWYAAGRLWGVLGTVVTVAGQDKAGIAYFSVNPGLDTQGHLGANISRQGYVGVANNNVTYPTVAVLPSGKGAMAFTLVGRDYYPSAAYLVLNEEGAGNVHVAAAGKGPQDGFTEYWPNQPPRWGDYGAAVTDGSSIWIASEYIAQTCDLTTYVADTTCGGTRDKYVNWSTRISNVKP